MNTSTPSRPSQLSDDELIAAVKRHAYRTRESTVALIVHLTELESRRIHLAAGFGSLFEYCREELRLSEHAAYHLIKAIRPARRFPLVLDKLLDGSLNVSTVRVIGPFLKRHNYEELLSEVSGKSKRQVEEIRARLAPRPDAPSSIRRLPDSAPMASPPAPTAFALAPMGSAQVGLFTTAPATAGIPSTSALPEERSTITPLSPGRCKVTFTADEAMHDLIVMAQEMLSHAIPNGDPKEIFRRALESLARDLARKKFTDAPRPRKSRGPAPGSRGPSVKVQREVWVRDAGRCRFVGRDGRRCTERRFIQFHHCEKPYAAGGEATVENMQLRCGAHNRYEAELYFGRDKVQRAIGVVSEPAARYRVSHMPQLAPGPVRGFKSAARHGRAKPCGRTVASRLTDYARGSAPTPLSVSAG